MLILWIVILVLGTIGEAATAALVSIWFAVGALGALIANFMGANSFVQWLVFLGVSIILLIFTRPFLKRFMPKIYTPTNGELDIGKKAIVIEKIDAQADTGRVRIEGVDWKAESEDGSIIENGTTVIVVDKASASVKVRKS